MRFRINTSAAIKRELGLPMGARIKTVIAAVDEKIREAEAALKPGEIQSL